MEKWSKVSHSPQILISNCVSPPITFSLKTISWAPNGQPSLQKSELNSTKPSSTCSAEWAKVHIPVGLQWCQLWGGWKGQPHKLDLSLLLKNWYKGNQYVCNSTVHTGSHCYHPVMRYEGCWSNLPKAWRAHHLPLSCSGLLYLQSSRRIFATVWGVDPTRERHLSSEVYSSWSFWHCFSWLQIEPIENWMENLRYLQPMMISCPILALIWGLLRLRGRTRRGRGRRQVLPTWNWLLAMSSLLFIPTTSLESASFTLKVIAEVEEENEDADCGSKWMVGGKGNKMPSTW